MIFTKLPDVLTIVSIDGERQFAKVRYGGDAVVTAKLANGRELVFSRSDGTLVATRVECEYRVERWRIAPEDMSKIQAPQQATPEQCAAQQAGVDRVTQTVTVDVSADVAARIDDLKKEVDAAIAEAKEASGSAAVVFADVFADVLKDPPKQAATSMATDFGVARAGKYADDVVAELRKRNSLRAAADMVIARRGLASDNMAKWRASRGAAGDAEPIYNITLIANSAEGGKAAAEAFANSMREWQERRCAAG